MMYIITHDKEPNKKITHQELLISSGENTY